MSKPFGIIYKATNLINGKCYIGQTTKELNKRKNEHIHNSIKNKDNIYFHNAIRKYGIDNFEWSIVKECFSRNELNRWEEILIIENNGYYTMGGYNCKYGGDNYGHSEQTIQKLKIKAKGRQFSELAKINSMKALKGKKQSEELIRKRSEGLKGHTCSDETKKKIGNSNKKNGRKYPCEIMCKAIELSKEMTPLNISKIMNIPRRTIQSWIKQIKRDGCDPSLYYE